jgi:hypothetical protein
MYTIFPLNRLLTVTVVFWRCNVNNIKAQPCLILFLSDYRDMVDPSHGQPQDTDAVVLSKRGQPLLSSFLLTSSCV